MARCVILLTCLVAAQCHPGTWDGEIIMNENGAQLPDLSGEWADAEDSFQLRIFQPLDEPAAAPNSSYARILPNGRLLEVCKLEPIFSYENRSRIKTTIRCQGVAREISQESQREGIVLNESHVTWQKSCWMKKASPAESSGRFTEPKIRKVHVVFMWLLCISTCFNTVAD